MAGEVPSRNDIIAIFNRLRSIPTNKQCFDCGATNPTWASVTYGVFLCIDCSAVHRSLGVHLTFIRSTQLDTSWTWLQLRAMQVGGNASATGFFRQHGCNSNDAQQKYHSRAAQMYREKLHSLALKTMKLHGTKLHLDHTHASPASPLEKEVDFFKEHENSSSSRPVNSDIPSTGSMNLSSEPVPISNGSLSSTNKPVPEDPNEGPSVEAALSMSPTEALQIAEPRKATIGGRKPAGAKKGLGGKKGLGAQRVKTNFNDIENAAQRRDKEKLELEANMAAQVVRTKEEEEKKMASMRLAYKDLSMDEERRTEKMKHMDPKKAKQMERLGMGMGAGAEKGKSHSAFSDMTTIEQESVPGNSHDRYSSAASRGRQRDFDDDFELLGGGLSSGPPKYDDSPFGLKKEDKYSSNYGSSRKWDGEDRFETKQSSFLDDTSTSSMSSKARDDDRGRSRKNYEVSGSEEAQKKFGNAKSISSDAYFGKNDPDLETRQNLSKYDGSTSISSDQFFGKETPTRSRQSNYDDYGGGPDLQEIKDGVKQGVTKVAGKLSNLANGVINSLQDYSG